jgi:adenosylcobinamide-phosphate synthase
MNSLISGIDFQPLLILWLAIAIDASWRWPQRTHPLTLMRYLVTQMGRKVLPSSSFAPSQHYISGTLAAIVLLSPFVICLSILISMAEYPVFFDGVIMVVLLDYGYQRQQYKKVLASVGRNKKSLARELVSSITARQCDTLTDIGIAKAAIESLWLKFLYLFCGVIFYYVVFGPIGALVYRLLLLTSWQWHYRNPNMALFAKPMRKVVSLLVFPPALLGAFITLLISSPISGIKAIKRCPANDKTSLLLATLGGIHDIKLGGPAIYANRKIRYPRVGGEHDVKFSSMVYVKRTITSAMISVTAVATLMLILIGQHT